MEVIKQIEKENADVLFSIMEQSSTLEHCEEQKANQKKNQQAYRKKCSVATTKALLEEERAKNKNEMEALRAEVLYLRSDLEQEQKRMKELREAFLTFFNAKFG